MVGISVNTLDYLESTRHSYYNDVIKGAMASQITSLKIVWSSADQRKHQISASLAFVRGIHQWPVNFSRKCPVMRKMFPFDDVIVFWFIYRRVWSTLRWTVEAKKNIKFRCNKTFSNNTLYWEYIFVYTNALWVLLLSIYKLFFCGNWISESELAFLAFNVLVRLKRFGHWRSQYHFWSGCFAWCFFLAATKKL